MKDKLIIGFIFIGILFFSSAAYAGFADDWLDQHTSTNAGYFEGQQRGYFTGGGFSARLNQSVDYPISVTLPRLKAGCGGIDAFMGGFSFLNADYLVSKLQNVLQAAPFVAFDIALNTLCTECSNVMKSAESIANSLNSLQLDSCKASKAAVAYLTENLVDDPQKKGKLHEMHASFVTDSGIGTLYKKVDDLIKGADGNTTNIADLNYKNLISGCPPELKSLFIGDKKLLLDNIGVKLAVPQNYIDYVRDIVGDFYVDIQEKSLTLFPVPPCSANTKGAQNETAMVGKIMIKTGIEDSTCTYSSDVNKDLRQHVYNNLVSVITALKSKNGLNTGSPEYNFINKSPLPLMPTLKAAILLIPARLKFLMMPKHTLFK